LVKWHVPDDGTDVSSYLPVT